MWIAKGDICGEEIIVVTETEERAIDEWECAARDMCESYGSLDRMLETSGGELHSFVGVWTCDLSEHRPDGSSIIVNGELDTQSEADDKEVDGECRHCGNATLIIKGRDVYCWSCGQYQ